MSTLKAFILALLLALPLPAQKQFEFRGGITWGMDKEQVKQKESAAFLKPGPGSSLIFTGTYEGYRCYINYNFTEYKLAAASVEFNLNHSDLNAYIDDYNALINALMAKYGTPDVDEELWKDDLFANEPDKKGAAVAGGHLEYRATWRLEDYGTNIIVRLFGSDYKCRIIIRYNNRVRHTPDIRRK